MIPAQRMIEAIMAICRAASTAALESRSQVVFNPAKPSGFSGSMAAAAKIATPAAYCGV